MANGGIGEVDPDFAAEMTQKNLDAAVEEIRRKAQIAPGVPGECDKCGEDSPRLIGGVCARCRDEYKLP